MTIPRDRIFRTIYVSGIDRILNEMKVVGLFIVTIKEVSDTRLVDVFNMFWEVTER